MPGELRLALVGCGAISEWHRNAVSSVSEIEIVACVDVDSARASAAAGPTGAAVFGSIEEALDRGDFDAVDVMLPHDLHEQVAVTCLEAGKHVLLEKPMATTVAACDRILAAAERAPGLLMIGENAQYWPEVLIAKRLIEDGAIGDVITANAHLFFPPMAAYYGGDRPWRMQRGRSGGGVSIDAGSHYIRPLRMWLGEVREVVAAMERPFAAMEGESLARALMRFDSGRVASLDLLLTAAPIAPQEIFRITGTSGEILIGLGVRLVDEEHRKPMAMEPDTPQGYMLSYVGQFCDFAAAVLHGSELAAPAEASLGELRTALAMQRSTESRCWEPVWD
jgi:predicted dehydrogenase